MLVEGNPLGTRYHLRPCLLYTSKKAKLQYITRFISNHPEEAGIIYCLSRKNTEMAAQALIDLGINAAAYHAGMTAQPRASVQERFKMDQIQVVCATIAFGMGIDKSKMCIRDRSSVQYRESVHAG